MKSIFQFVLLAVTIWSFLSIATIEHVVYAFEPVPFHKIPSVIINTGDDKYKFTADYSLDFGGETKIKHDVHAQLASNMKLDKDDNSLSVEVKCDSNDICDDSLSPENVRVYFVDRGTRDSNIARNSIPLLELEKNDCGYKSLEDCAHFDFDILIDILTKKYKIVVDMTFDEAEWIFINPARILK